MCKPFAANFVFFQIPKACSEGMILLLYTLMIILRVHSSSVCSFGKCFKMARCDDKFTVHVYGNGSIIGNPVNKETEDMVKILRAIRGSPYHVDDPSAACLLVPNVDTHHPWTRREVHLRPFLDPPSYGANHLLFNWDDHAELVFPPSPRGLRAALLGRPKPNWMLVAQASAGGPHYRPTFDVSMGLLPTQRFFTLVNQRRIPPGLQLPVVRPLLLSFKGRPHTHFRRWLNSPVNHAAASLPGVRIIIENSDARDPFCNAECRASHNAAAQRTDFIDLLLQSTFSLCPEGFGRTSYRVAESLRLGSIPVLVSGRGGSYFLPFEDLITDRWVVFFPTHGEAEYPTLQLIVDTIQNISVKEVLRLRRAGQEVYQRFFSSPENQALGVLEAVRSRVERSQRELRASQATFN
eukprot:GGOE01041492.1.p1 GENE.GGOE01041492.1~~GGOE01041492.1.p1  ORF type:complete len:416 (+),score=46.34 GGOE01041492.1:25-1248(+)